MRFIFLFNGTWSGVIWPGRLRSRESWRYGDRKEYLGSGARTRDLLRGSLRAVPPGHAGGMRFILAYTSNFWKLKKKMDLAGSTRGLSWGHQKRPLRGPPHMNHIWRDPRSGLGNHGHYGKVHAKTLQRPSFIERKWTYLFSSRVVWSEPKKCWYLAVLQNVDWLHCTLCVQNGQHLRQNYMAGLHLWRLKLRILCVECAVLWRTYLFFYPDRKIVGTPQYCKILHDFTVLSVCKPGTCVNIPCWLA